jgi:hypothetical protein
MNHPCHRYQPNRDMGLKLTMCIGLGAAMLVYLILLIQVMIELRQKHCIISGAEQGHWESSTQNMEDIPSGSSHQESSTPLG